MKNMILFLASGFYSGKLPKAPGTWGSLVGIIIYKLFYPLPTSLFLLTLVGIIALSIWVSDEAARALGQKDPRIIVIDEIAGMLVTLALHVPTVSTLVIGFLLFRLFDVWKPFPCRSLEKLPGGWGIVLDDVMAGMYANIGLWFLKWMMAL
ncbi:MAG: phosphatidylglycerophosphatase A [Deltaproteobacteria bacterium]|nr:phosphatidylglycerophosphatase A [Deltaproteobacteria bacterium]